MEKGLPAPQAMLQHPGESLAGMVAAAVVGKKGWEGECCGFVFAQKSLQCPPQRCGERVCDFCFLDEASVEGSGRAACLLLAASTRKPGVAGAAGQWDQQNGAKLQGRDQGHCGGERHY